MADETDNRLVGSGVGEDAAVFGSGNSKFYVSADTASYRNNTPVPVRNPDPSLYLANSTFYRDRVPELIVPVPRNQPDPMPIVPVTTAASHPPAGNQVYSPVGVTARRTAADHPPKAPTRKKAISQYPRCSNYWTTFYKNLIFHSNLINVLMS